MKYNRIGLRVCIVFLAFAVGFGSIPGIARAEEPAASGTEQTETAAHEKEAAEPSEPAAEPQTEPVQEETAADAEPVQESVPETVPNVVAEVSITPEETELFIEDGPVRILLSCETEDADIYYALSPDGETYTDYALYTDTAEDLLLYAGFGMQCVKVYAEKEGYLPSGTTVCCFTERQSSGWDFYFGQLHGHSTFSDGYGTAEEIFAYAAQTEGLDFFAVTDHSNSFDGNTDGAIGEDAAEISREWAAGKAAALAVTDGQFVGIFGYEMTWQEGKHLGHLNTFNTPGFQSRNQAAYSSQSTALQNYYDTLATVPGSVSQFNHPGTMYGDFCDFDFYTEERDAAITLLEVGSGPDAYEYYTRALDRGWHVAPTNCQSNRSSHSILNSGIGEGRTVVCAESLTEAAIYDAMRNYRVYATEDRDITIRYTLDGNFMGSRLERGETGETAEISVSLGDPTDGRESRVAVIVDGGMVLAEQETQNGRAIFEVSTQYSYYYILVTQPDGDTAATAPVWIWEEEKAGIAGFFCDTAVPVRGQAVAFTLELYHQGKDDFGVEKIELFADGELVQTVEADGMSCTFTYVHDGLGRTELRAVVTASLGGEEQSYEQALTLNYRREDMVKTVLVDGAAEKLTQMTELAQRNQITVAMAEETITEEMLEDASILIVTAPEEPFSEEYLTLAAEFVETGGTLVVCGQSAALDGELCSSRELNRLLEAAGATLRLQADTAEDQYLASVCDADICGGVTEDQVFRLAGGCTVDPGEGAGLVWNSSEAVLAWEKTASGGKVYAAGSLFLGDGALAEPRNLWGKSYANRVILESLLRINRAEPELSMIGDARQGQLGEVYRIRGYVTAGTSDPYNAFPDTIYIQDDTGGIAAVSFRAGGIEVGAPLEIQGYLEVRDGNPVLEVISWELLNAAYQEFAPKTISNRTAMDYELQGGRLVQVEGEAVELTSAGEQGISRLVLKDDNGDLATVRIENCIFSGSTGKNTLAQEIRVGRRVRAMGLVHLDSDGSVVIRVRNCDEVVYVPPIPCTPDTGDRGIVTAGAALAASCAGLVTMGRKRRK